MNVDIYKCHAFKRQVLNFSNVDVSGLNNALLDFNWNQLFENQSNINVAYQKWYSQFRHIVERFIPLKIVPIKPKDKPWMTGEIRLAIRNVIVIYVHTIIISFPLLGNAIEKSGTKPFP